MESDFQASTCQNSFYATLHLFFYSTQSLRQLLESSSWTTNNKWGLGFQLLCVMMEMAAQIPGHMLGVRPWDWHRVFLFVKTITVNRQIKITNIFPSSFVIMY